MPNVVAIAGSPSHPSRSYAVLEYARRAVEKEGLSTASINVRDLPPEVLIYGQFANPDLKAVNDLVVEAKGITLFCHFRQKIICNP